MKKNRLLIGLVIVFTIMIGAVLYTLLLEKNTRYSLTPENSEYRDTYNSLGCGRSTADYKMTDPLCTNLEYAAKLFNSGVTFSSVDRPSKRSTIILASGTKKVEPIALKHVVVKTVNQIECVKPPCELTIFDGNTDELGQIILANPLGKDGELVKVTALVDGMPASTQSFLASTYQDYLFVVQ